MILPNREPALVLNPWTVGTHPALQAALAKLAHAEACARDIDCDAWQYAVEIDNLLAEGLQWSDLRWLVDRGYVTHAVEITRASDTMRRFTPCRNRSFRKATCFVLTAAGAQLAGGSDMQPRVVQPNRLPDEHLRLVSGHSRGAGVPSWDGTQRILRVDGQVVKRFKVPSPAQEAILGSFEEEGWPRAIDDPLPPQPEQDTKHRLRNTLERLNANQKNPLLRFGGDGSGERIIWQFSDAPGDSSTTGKQLLVRAA